MLYISHALRVLEWLNRSLTTWMSMPLARTLSRSASWGREVHPVSDMLWHGLTGAVEVDDEDHEALGCRQLVPWRRALTPANTRWRVRLAVRLR